MAKGAYVGIRETVQVDKNYTEKIWMYDLSSDTTRINISAFVPIYDSSSKTYSFMSATKGVEQMNTWIDVPAGPSTENWAIPTGDNTICYYKNPTDGYVYTFVEMHPTEDVVDATTVTKGVAHKVNKIYVGILNKDYTDMESISSHVSKYPNEEVILCKSKPIWDSSGTSLYGLRTPKDTAVSTWSEWAEGRYTKYYEYPYILMDESTNYSLNFQFVAVPIDDTMYVYADGQEPEGIAHLVKKGYVGVGGVARPCWGGGDTVAFHSAVSMSGADIGWKVAASNNKYALFAGGVNASLSNNRVTDTVVTTDSNLTFSNSMASVLPSKSYWGPALSIGDYAIFAMGAGGKDDSSDVVAKKDGYVAFYDVSSTSFATAYNDNLVQSSISPSPIPVTNAGCASLKNAGIGIILGGSKVGTTDGEPTTSGFAFDSNLTCTPISYSGTARTYMTGGVAENRMMFLGGSKISDSSWDPSGSNIFNEILKYDSDLVASKSWHKNLVFAASGTLKTNYTKQTMCIFAGGSSGNESGSQFTNEVVAFGDDGSSQSLSDLPFGIKYMTGLTMGDKVVFAGGCTSEATGISDVYVYNGNLTRTNDFSLQYRGAAMAGAVFNQYGILSPGRLESSSLGGISSSSRNNGYYQILALV